MEWTDWPVVTLAGLRFQPGAALFSFLLVGFLGSWTASRGDSPSEKSAFPGTGLLFLTSLSFGLLTANLPLPAGA